LHRAGRGYVASGVFTRAGGAAVRFVYEPAGNGADRTDIFFSASFYQCAYPSGLSAVYSANGFSRRSAPDAPGGLCRLCDGRSSRHTDLQYGQMEREYQDRHYPGCDYDRQFPGGTDVRPDEVYCRQARAGYQQTESGGAYCGRLLLYQCIRRPGAVCPGSDYSVRDLHYTCDLVISGGEEGTV